MATPDALQLFGVTLVGATPENGRNLLLTLAVRFLSPDHGTREIKDAMSREILARLDEAGLGIASATYEITGLPTLHVASSAP